LTNKEFYRGRSPSAADREAKLRYRMVINWIAPRPSLVVREVGCGRGVLYSILKHVANLDYLGIDINEDLTKESQGFPLLIHNANLGLPFPASSADYVVALEVLEHLENARFFFQEAARVLRPDGKLILSVPNPYCWNEFLANVRRQADGQGHITSFTYQNISALASFSGFAIVQCCGIFTRLPFSRRLLGNYVLVPTSNICLTRSFCFLLQKKFPPIK